MKARTFKRKPGAMIGYAVAMTNLTMGEIIIVAPTRSAAAHAAEQVGLRYVDLQQVKRVAVSLDGAQAAAQQNGESNADQA